MDKSTTQADATLSNEEEKTPKETPTLTESQVRVREAKARNDALAEVGRLRKAADDANKIAQDVVRRLQQREEADLAREEEAIKDDPEKLSALRLKRDAIRIKAEVEEIKRTTEVEKAEIQSGRQEILQHHADRLSERYNVNADILLKYGGNSKSSLEDLAKSYGEKVSDESKIRVTSPPDSGKTKGGGKELTVEDVKKMSPQERFERSAEIAKLPLTI